MFMLYELKHWAVRNRAFCVLLLPLMNWEIVLSQKTLSCLSVIGLWLLLKTFCCSCRIIESSELEQTFKGHLVQLPSNEQGHPQLDHVAQSPVQPDLECLQGWGIHQLSWQPVPVPHHTYCKNLLPSIQPKSPLQMQFILLTAHVTFLSIQHSI